MYFLSGAWHGPVKIGMGPLESPPAAAVRASNEVDLIWQGGDGSLWESYENGSTWAAPTSLHVYLGPPSTLAITALGTEVDAFWMSPANSDLWEIFHEGAS
jgi:hypothetical protein